MGDLKASSLDRLYLVGAIHRMGERTGAAAERILDDLDTLLAENAKLNGDRARQQLAKDRATDEELEDLYNAAFDAGPSGVHDSRVVALRAVAARVRQERCLVAEAVGMGAGVTISRTSERVPGTTGMWDVYVTRRPDVPGEHYAYGVPTADVPATLARLLGEVSR